jgi:hypothetical protein
MKKEKQKEMGTQNTLDRDCRVCVRVDAPVLFLAGTAQTVWDTILFFCGPKGGILR